MDTQQKPVLRFACTNTTSGMEKCGSNYFCRDCSKTVVDFRNKPEKEIRQLRLSMGSEVCGIFNHSQLYAPFARYAATTLIAATTLMAQGCGEDTADIRPAPPADGEELSVADALIGAIAFDMIHDNPVVFAQPAGGFPPFFEALKAELQYPEGLHIEGKVFVQLTIDVSGKLIETRVLKGLSETADREVVRAISALNYKFEPAQGNNGPVKSTVVIPVMFR